MEHDTTRSDARRHRRTGAGEPRRRVRRGSVAARRRRTGTTTPGRDARSSGQYRHEDATRRAWGGPASTSEATWFGRIAPPHRLAWLLAVFARRGGAPLTASGLLWLFLAIGWRVGVLDADAVLWLSAGVVLAAHVLAVGSPPADSPSERSAGRSGSDRYRDASR